MDDVLKQAGHRNTNTRASFFKLSRMAPNIWNSLPDSLKATMGPNTYKHKVKKQFLDRLYSYEKQFIKLFLIDFIYFFIAIFFSYCYYYHYYYLYYYCYY